MTSAFLRSKLAHGLTALQIQHRGRHRTGALLLVLWLGGMAFAPGARAQNTEPGSAATAEPWVPDSPRGSLTHFLELTREGHFSEAARYLELPAGEEAEGAEQARRLKAVLDRFVWLEPDQASNAPRGRLDDGLPADTEEVAQLPRPDGTKEPVRMVRRRLGGGRWLFSLATVERIDTWYAGLQGRWLLEHVPTLLLRTGPHELLWAQWLLLPPLLLLAGLLGYLLTRLTRAVLERIVARTRSQWDDLLLLRMGGPLALVWTLVVFSVLQPLLGLNLPATVLLGRWVRAGFLVVFFWGLDRAVDVVREVLALSPWAATHPASRSLLPLGARVAKVGVVAVGVVALLSELGYPVASLVAGLGIGGLAVALAAQKTMENLFGAFSIGADQPFRVGDFIKLEGDVSGTVEAVGLRSTRIRTQDRTLVTLPNGKLSDMRVESFAARDRIRLACVLSLSFATRVSQLREVLASVEAKLRAHPKLWPDDVTVRFIRVGDCSLDIDINAWLQTRDYAEFQRHREELLLQFLEVVEAAGAELAVPTRVVRMQGEPSR